MDAGDRLRLSDAVNAGLQDFYLKAPPLLKRGFIAGLLPAPRTVTLGLVQGSRAISVYTTTDDDIYQTVVIGGVRNRITPGGLLLYPWQGTTGSHVATIYGDAATWGGSEPILEMLAGHPLVDDEVTVLPWEDMPQAEVTTGCPTNYRVENYGQVLPGRPYWCLRVWPLPDVAYRISMPASLTAFMVSSDNLTDEDVIMPIEDRLIIRFVLPFALYHLMTHRLWKLPETQRVIREQYQLALADLASIPRHQHTPDNKVGTPRGY
jgi:hypothetical protein